MKVFDKIGDALLTKVFKAKEYKGLILTMEQILNKFSSNRSIRIKKHIPNNNIQTIITNQYQTSYEDFTDSFYSDSWTMLGLYDGHGGSRGAEIVRNKLLQTIYINWLNSQNEGGISIEEIISESFVDCDNMVLEEEKISGAKAIACVFDNSNSDLYVANCGTCRAVLGKIENDAIKSIPLSRDHTAMEESHLLRSRFPEDDDIIKGGKIKGILDHSRGFGDALFKSGGKLLAMMARKTDWNPPYSTCQPEISRVEIDPETDKFLVIGSEGLWRNVSNVEIVNIVNDCLLNCEDPTLNVLANIAEKRAKVGSDFLQRVSSVVHTPDGFKKIILPDLSICVVVFDEDYYNFIDEVT